MKLIGALLVAGTVLTEGCQGTQTETPGPYSNHWTVVDGRYQGPQHMSFPLNRANVLTGSVTSDSGQPLPNVQLTLNILTNPVSGRYDTEIRTIGTTFHESAPGEIWDVTFALDGYYPRRYYCGGNKLVFSSEGVHEQPTSIPGPSQPTNDLHIVLRKKGTLVKVQQHMETLWLDGSGTGAVMDPNKPDSAWDSVLWTPNVDRAPAGCFYISAKRDNMGILAVPALHREKYPTYKPAEIRLGIADASSGEGIQLFHVTDEADRWFQMRQAPTAGYQAQITLDGEAIQRLANNEYLYFFIKSRGIYSCGFLTDWALSNFQNDHFTHYGIRAFLTTQPDGKPNFETGE